MSQARPAKALSGLPLDVRRVDGCPHSPNQVDVKSDSVLY